MHYTFEPREIKARMDSLMVKAVLDMGFPRELVRHAIQVQLSTTGKITYLLTLLVNVFLSVFTFP